MSLQRRAIRGVLGYGSFSFVRFVLSLAVQVAFARLLLPYSFGVVSLAAAILTGLTLIGRWGISEAIMQDTEYRHVFSTIFWIRAGYSAFVVAFAGVFAFFARGFFEDVVLTALVVLAVGKAVTSLSSPFTAVMEREFDLVRLATLDLVALIIGAAIGLWMALDGFGVWGLVVFYTSYETIFGASTIVVSPRLPAVAFDRDTARWFVGFAWSLLFSKSLSAVESRADDLVIGTVGGSTVLGLYTVAFRLTEAFSTVFQTTIRKGILPTFSRIQDLDEQSEQALAFLLRMQTYAVVPLYILVAATATDIVVLLFGEQWTEAGPLLRLLAPAGIFIPLVASMRQYYYSIGEGPFVLRIQVVYLSVFMIGLLLLVPLFGGFGGATATVGSQILGFLLFVYVLQSNIGLRPSSVFSLALLAGTVTVAVTLLIHLQNFGWQIPQFVLWIPASRHVVQIGAYGCLICLTFYTMLYLVRPAVVRSDWEIVYRALVE